MFEEVDPCRAAGGHNREFDTLVTRKECAEALKNLSAFFHNGKVRSEVCVEHVVKAQTAEGTCELPGNYSSGLVAEFLTKSDSYRWCGLGNDDLVGIADILEETVRIIALHKSSGRAHGNALTAVGAVRVRKHIIEGGGDSRIKSTPYCTENANRLDIVTYAFAAAAEYALVHIAGNGDSGFLLAG